MQYVISNGNIARFKISYQKTEVVFIRRGGKLRKEIKKHLRRSNLRKSIKYLGINIPRNLS